MLVIVGLLGGVLAEAGATAAAPWQAAVERTMAETCAIRGLTLKQPVTVRPMSEFDGGYTPGIGSVAWEAEYAETWRAGWCALGVYCARKVENNDLGESPLRGPQGLYDRKRNALFVKGVSNADGDWRGTVAHELVHALQYHTFPTLNAIHLWQNRDLAAAANAVVEGDAHLVGWWLDPAERYHLCDMAPRDRDTRQPRRWNWTPDGFWAHEGFPHAFGPELALERLLAAGQKGVDALLRKPPLSTLGVLRPHQEGAVEFIKLPDLAAETDAGARKCKAGLTNTAGALGIWGLLLQHGDPDATAAELPEFLDHWLGDRFHHLACSGDHDDELAWLTRWRSADAAQEFADRYRGVATSIPSYGGLLASPPAPFVRGRSVVVATPGLNQAVPSIEHSKVETFSRYSDWIASDCFPDEECYAIDAEAASSGRGQEYICATASSPPAEFVDWLDRVRQARRPPPPQGELEAVMENTGQLATFCAVNGRRNTDFLQACRAAYNGTKYLVGLLRDTRWQRMPYCFTNGEFRHWIETTYYGEHDRPFAAESIFPGLYGPPLAMSALAGNAGQGLEALASAPPLSTLQVLRPNHPSVVDFIRMPRDQLAALGCEVAASDVRGVLAIWNLLMDYGQAPEEDALPPFLRHWRGDRTAFIRCGERAGWAWISRWGNAAAARAFAERYRDLAPLAAQETGLPAVSAQIDGRTVWVLPPFLKKHEAILRNHTEVREFGTFRKWVADGCFPQVECN